MEQPDKEVVVVKYGSTSVTNEAGMDIGRIGTYSNQISRLLFRYNVVIVSSGAIVTGRAIEKDKPKMEDGDYASVGSVPACAAWQKELSIRSISSGQVPVTNHEIDSIEGESLRRRMFSMMRHEIVPVANGNDVLSDEGPKELRIDTDNDRLAGHIAKLLAARHLILVTDKPGLQERNDKVVSLVTPDNLEGAYSLVREEDNNGESGGMHSKIDVAYDFSEISPIRPQPGFAHIAGARDDLQSVIAGHVGTHFAPHD
jgi:glutamate 5-kinase